MTTVSSPLNLGMNLSPRRISASLRGRKRHITLMLHSAGSAISAVPRCAALLRRAGAGAGAGAADAPLPAGGEGRGGAGPGEAGSRSVPLRAGSASPLASRPGAAAGLQERHLSPPRPRGFVAAPQYAGPARRARHAGGWSPRPPRSSRLSARSAAPRQRAAPVLGLDPRLLDAAALCPRR